MTIFLTLCAILGVIGASPSVAVPQQSAAAPPPIDKNSNITAAGLETATFALG